VIRAKTHRGGFLYTDSVIGQTTSDDRLEKRMRQCLALGLYARLYVSGLTTESLLAAIGHP